MLIYNLTKDFKIIITENRIIKKIYVSFLNALKINLYFMCRNAQKMKFQFMFFNILKLTI